MSRFSAEPWRLVLGRDHWHFHGDGGTQRVPAGDDPATALAGLSSALPVRRRLLQRTRLEVELADHWVRHLVVQWPRGLRDRERTAWLGDRFAAVHDLAPAEWVMAVDRDADGERALASAAPRAMVAAVSAFAKERRATVAGFGSRFTLGFNRVRQGLEGECGVFALYAEERLTVGLWRRGEWLRVRSLAAGAQPGLVLSQTLAGWWAALPTEVQGAVVHGLGVEPAFLPPGWQQSAVSQDASSPSQPWRPHAGLLPWNGLRTTKGRSR